MVNKKSKLSLCSCVILLIGAMFGSAIFSLSGLTIYEAGPASLISWAIAAFIMFIYGLLMSELAHYYPKSGGVYVFPAQAIKGIKGKFWGWVSCWGYILGNFAAISFSAIFVGIYLSLFIPEAQYLQVPIAIFSIIIVFVLNCIKFRNSGIINNTFVVLLILIMIVFVIASITNSNFEISNFNNFFDQGNSGNLAFLSMVPVCIVAYSSIVAIAFMASEVKNPRKTIPKASIIAIVVIALIYLLIIIATLGLITSDYLSTNPQYQMTPIFAACSNLANAKWLTPLVSVASVIALITTMNVLVSVNSRAIQASAIDKILPSIFAKTSKNGQPIFAVVVTVLICAIISCFPDYVNSIVNLGVAFNALTITITVIALLIARKKEQQVNTYFKFWGKNIWAYLFLVILFSCSVVSIITSDLFLVCVYTLIFLVIGILIFIISRVKK